MDEFVVSRFQRFAVVIVCGPAQTFKSASLMSGWTSIAYPSSRGYVFDLWPNPVPPNLTGAPWLDWKAKLQCLQEVGWLGPAARAVTVSMVTYEYALLRGAVNV